MAEGWLGAGGEAAAPEPWLGPQPSAAMHEPQPSAAMHEPGTIDNRLINQLLYYLYVLVSIKYLTSFSSLLRPFDIQ